MDSRRLFHPITTPLDTTSMRLNDPFDYEPHRLVRDAAQRVVEYLGELDEGKMLGVLVALAPSGEVGFFSAFSGALRGATTVAGFVPPIYDLDCEGGYFRDEERRISLLGAQISALRDSPSRLEAIATLASLKVQCASEMELARSRYTEARRQRHQRRAEGLGDDLLRELEREGQHQKGELRRYERHLRHLVDEQRSVVEDLDLQIAKLTTQRLDLSNALQRRLFESYRVVNGEGQWSSIYSIFEESLHRLPPAGTGDCAAPKLLHYALVGGYKPLAVGEFWHGASPRSEVRRDGVFYGACRGKCEPLLRFVLRGLDYEPSLAPVVDHVAKLIFEDDHIAIFDKPAGMLSVAGRSDQPSLERQIEERYCGAKVAHRLDQDTSGVILVAKSNNIYRVLQRQFAERTLVKRYVAVVEGVIPSPRGTISLPLVANYNDRPRQMVDYNVGKEAISDYELLEITPSGNSRIALYPHTGRTHQLRLHAAHPAGLNAPIVGDRLYGGGASSAPRLYLNAEAITFTHPVTGERLTFTAETTF